jgi:hypothetical protein
LSGISSEEGNGKVRDGRKNSRINLSSIIKEHRQLAKRRTVILSNRIRVTAEVRITGGGLTV